MDSLLQIKLFGLSLFISHTTNSPNKFTHLLIQFLYEKEIFLPHKGYAICFCYFRCFSLVYCLVAFLIRWMKKIHIRTILAWIFSPITVLYIRGTMDSKKDFWQERFVLLIICLFLVIIHFYADLLINK